nr:WS/DGAT domain-containing protein [Nocardioides humi]
MTSYDGGVYYGITADRDWIPDADLLGACLREALDELIDLSSATRQRAPRGRRTAKSTAKGSSTTKGSAKDERS